MDGKKRAESKASHFNPYVLAEITPRSRASKEKAAEEELRVNGARIILFVLGGVTYSEMRSIYELRKDMRRDVILGNPD
eukprot:jgi/Hompol1/4431/HPOL_007106-RA